MLLLVERQDGIYETKLSILGSVKVVVLSFTMNPPAPYVYPVRYPFYIMLLLHFHGHLFPAFDFPTRFSYTAFDRCLSWRKLSKEESLIQSHYFSRHYWCARSIGPTLSKAAHPFYPQYSHSVASLNLHRALINIS